jgi:hypothetical protein
MRKIETQMIEAIENQLNWQVDNTQVINSELASDGTVVSVVKLHGHKIAVIGDNFIQLFDGGWQTATTKSRLNAILKGFGVDGESVFQKDFNWFYRKFVGAMNGQQIFILKEFESGMFA